MSDVAWSRLKEIATIIAALVPLTGSVVVVYSGLEVVKSQIDMLKKDNNDLHDDLQHFQSEYRTDIREIRNTIQQLHFNPDHDPNHP